MQSKLLKSSQVVSETPILSPNNKNAIDINHILRIKFKKS